MPAITPKLGVWYELKADYGSDHGYMPKGSLLQITHLLDAGEPGHGFADEEPIIMRFLEESSVTGRVVQRRISVRPSAFAGMFKTGKEPAELARWTEAQRFKESS